MGISTALLSIHDDNLHTGSAKRNAASGVKGIDASQNLTPKATLNDIGDGIFILEAALNHTGAIDNFWISAVTGVGTATTDAANHLMNLSTTIAGAASASFRSAKTYTPSAKPLVFNALIQAPIVGNVTNRVTWIGFKADFTAVGGSPRACFAYNTAGNWTTDSHDGVAAETNAIAALNAGDFITIVETTTSITFYVNGALVATHTVRFPTTAMYAGASVNCTGGGATAREQPIDFISVKSYK
jgi:hypothetical protein